MFARWAATARADIRGARVAATVILSLGNWTVARPLLAVGVVGVVVVPVYGPVGVEGGRHLIRVQKINYLES